MGYSRYGVSAKNLITYIAKGGGERWYVTPFADLRVVTVEGALFTTTPTKAVLHDRGKRIPHEFDSFTDAEDWAFRVLVERINRRRAGDINAQAAARRAYRIESEIAATEGSH